MVAVYSCNDKGLFQNIFSRLGGGTIQRKRERVRERLREKEKRQIIAERVK